MAEEPYTRFKRSRYEIEDEEVDDDYSNDDADEDESGSDSDSDEDEDADSKSSSDTEKPREYYIKAADEEGTRWTVRVEEGKLHMPAVAKQLPHSTAPTPTSTLPPQTLLPSKPPLQYVVYEELYYHDGDNEKTDKKIHWETIYESLHDANTAARDMIIDHLGLDYDEDDDDDNDEEKAHSEAFQEDKNAGSHSKPYSGCAELSPMFYYDPMEVTVRVIEAASAQTVVGSKKRCRVQ